MIKIYHIEGRRSERIVWLLEEIGGIDYELDYLPGDILGSLIKLEDVHEMRMTPIIQDGDRIMIESGAILEYLMDKFGAALRPSPNSPEYPAYLQFMHFAEGTAMAKIVLDWQLQGLLAKTGEKSPFPALPGLAGSRNESERIMYFADNVLAKSRYFAGENFTAADIMMHFPMKMGGSIATRKLANPATLYDTDNEMLANWPHVRRFLKDMDSRPAYQRALKATMPNGPPAF